MQYLEFCEWRHNEASISYCIALSYLRSMIYNNYKKTTFLIYQGRPFEVGGPAIPPFLTTFLPKKSTGELLPGQYAASSYLQSLQVYCFQGLDLKQVMKVSQFDCLSSMVATDRTVSPKICMLKL